jgi:hypothetical protein
MSRRTTKPNWYNQPISRTCEVVLDFNTNRRCGKPTAKAYKASGMGWMALCEECGKPHDEEATDIKLLIAQGEKFEELP